MPLVPSQETGIIRTYAVHNSTTVLIICPHTETSSFYCFSHCYQYFLSVSLHTKLLKNKSIHLNTALHSLKGGQDSVRSIVTMLWVTYPRNNAFIPDCHRYYGLHILFYIFLIVMTEIIPLGRKHTNTKKILNTMQQVR